MWVYRITNHISGRQYIGRTAQGLKARWRKHVWEATKGRHINIALHNAIRKYGENSFSIEVLARFISETDLLDAERLFIYVHQNNNARLYNMTQGGDGSLGLKHRNCTKIKIREKALARDMKNTSVRQVPCVIDGVEYPSRIKAAAVLGVHRKTVTRWIKNGKRRFGRWPKHDTA